MNILKVKMPHKFLSILLATCVSMMLSGCLQLEANTSTTSVNQHTDSTGTNLCGIYNPNELVMCTMDFDPVCLKEKQANGRITYRTAGNSCSACNTAQAISYTSGECKQESL